MTESCLLPEFGATEVADIAHRLFGLEGPTRQLHGERDLNFLISDQAGKFVLKIANAQESPAMLECQHLVFLRIADAKVFPLVATALESVNGQSIENVSDARGNQHCCRVLPFLEGQMWTDLRGSSPQLLADLGRRLALLDLALDSFSHPGLERPLLWNMEQAVPVLEAYKPLLASASERELIEYFEAGFRMRVLPLKDELRRAVIHNDANRENVIVSASGNEVAGIIDFGDMMHLWLVVEPAIAATYAMLDSEDRIGTAQTLLRGYHQTLPLTETEIGIVFDLICMRLCMSVCICAHQRRLEPGNDYLSIDEQDCWTLLGKLREFPHTDARDALLSACDL